jgi:AcrR family transcriptional regulator
MFARVVHVARKVKVPEVVRAAVPSVAGDGRATRWDEHRDRRRQEFVEATVRAIDAHGPDVSIATIAAEAGVSKPVLYRYFTDKAELHAAVGRWGAEQVLTSLLPALESRDPVRVRVAKGVEAYLATIEQHPQVFLLLIRQRSQGNDPLADGRATIAATVARVLGDNLRALDVDAAGAEPWAQGLVGLGVATGEWWLERRTMSREAVARYLTEFVWHAFEGIAQEYGVALPDEEGPR